MCMKKMQFLGSSEIDNKMIDRNKSHKSLKTSNAEHLRPKVFV